MNILIACEESQKVCSEFRKLGHVAYSCDIQEPSGGHPEWHINDDVLPLLNGNCTFHTMDGVEHSVIGKWDMLISFPPCFVADTLVMTYDGLKPISNICVGDLVLTHLGRFKRVTSVMMHEASNLCKVKSTAQGEVSCTSNHRFYVKTRERKHEANNNTYELSDFDWISADQFQFGSSPKRTFTSSVIDNLFEDFSYSGVDIGCNAYSTKHVKNLDTFDENFWYIIGRYLGDGYFIL